MFFFWPLPTHHSNFLWELGFLLKLLGFLNETTWAISTKFTSHLRGMKFGSGLHEVSRGRPEDSFYNPCLSVLYENGYMDKSEHFQLSSSIKLSSKKYCMKGEQITRASPTRGRGSRAWQLEPSSVSQATLKDPQRLLHIPQNTIWNPPNILLLRSKILDTLKHRWDSTMCSYCLGVHFDQREDPVMKATLVQTHTEENVMLSITYEKWQKVGSVVTHSQSLHISWYNSNWISTEDKVILEN